MRAAGERAFDAVKQAMDVRVSQVYRDAYVRKLEARGNRAAAGVDWEATKVALGWLGRWDIRAANVKRMWRKLLTGEERQRKFRGMASDTGARADGRCRWGCRCKETLWHAVVGCTKRKLGEQRAKFLKDYHAAVGGGNFDVGAVVRIMKSRMQWKVRGDFVVVGGEERPEVECIIFGFVPCWLEREVAAAFGDDDKVTQWLRAHGKFVKQWFWRQWKDFKAGAASCGE